MNPFDEGQQLPPELLALMQSGQPPPGMGAPPQGPPGMPPMGGPADMGMGGDPMGGGMDPWADPAAQVHLPPEFLPGAVEEQLDLRIKLDPQAQLELGARLGREYYHHEQVFARRRSNAQVWRDDASMMPTPPITGGDSDGSTVWMAQATGLLTSTAARSAKQKLVQQIVMPHPPFAVIPEVPQAEVNGQMTDLVQRAPEVEEALTALLEEARWREVASELFDEITVVSPAAVKAVWFKDVIHVAEKVIPQDEEMAVGLAEAGVDPREAWMESFDTDSQGRPKPRVLWKEKTLREGVQLTVVPFEDLIFFPATARHTRDAFAVGERVRLKGCDLIEQQKNRKSGYYADAIEEQLKMPSDAFTEAERQRLDRAGMTADSPTSEDLPEHREWKGIEIAYRGRLGNDKFDKWYWLTVALGTGRLLRACAMLDRHGLCPYEIFNYDGNKIVGMSVAELNATHQNSYTLLLNAFHDLLYIMVCCGGSFMVEEGAQFDVNRFRLAPGRPIEIQNIKSVAPLPFAENIPQALGQIIGALAMVKEDSQTLTSTSNISLGKEAQGDKTLGELQMVFSQDQAISEVLGYGVALGWGNVLEKFRQLEAQYCKTAKRAYIAQDESGVRHLDIEPELLAAPYKIIPAGLTASSSAQARAQKAGMILNTVLSNPYTANVPEIIFDALENVLQTLGAPQYRKWIALAKDAYMQQQMMMQQQQAALQGQEQEQAALQQGNVEQELALKQEQAGQAQQGQADSVRLKENDQALSVLGLIGKLGQQPASNGKASKK